LEKIFQCRVFLLRDFKIVDEFSEAAGAEAEY